MPHKLDYKHLRTCIDNYESDQLFIRLVGSYGGTKKVNEMLEGKSLDFKKNKNGLYLLIDKKEVFHFPLKDTHKGFSIAYERFHTDGSMHLPAGLTSPYDPTFPKPKRSYLRAVWDNHLMEIFFKGRIDIKFHSWMDKPHLKYWTIDKSKLPNTKNL